MPTDLSFLRRPATVKRIIAVTAACAVLGGSYGLLAPKWYESTATLVPARRSGGAASVFGAEIAGLASLATGNATSSEDGPRITAVLQSVSVTDAAIERFDLRKRYGRSLQESAREALWSHCVVKVDPKPNLIRLTCEDGDPRFAQQLVGFLAEHGNQVFRRVSATSASEEVAFLGDRVKDLRKAADETAARMQSFQERYKIIDIDTQAKAVVSSLAGLYGERISKELELDYARLYSSRDEPTTRQLESQVGIMRDKLRELEGEPSSPAAPTSAQARVPRRPGMFPAPLEVPRLRAEFEVLYRDRKVSEAALVFAMQRLEAARADEARAASTFLLLDPPTLASRQASPRPLRATALSGLLGCLIMLLGEWLWSERLAQQKLTELRTIGKEGRRSTEPAACR